MVLLLSWLLSPVSLLPMSSDCHFESNTLILLINTWQTLLLIKAWKIILLVLGSVYKLQDATKATSTQVGWVVIITTHYTFFFSLPTVFFFLSPFTTPLYTPQMLWKKKKKNLRVISWYQKNMKWSCEEVLFNWYWAIVSVHLRPASNWVLDTTPSQMITVVGWSKKKKKSHDQKVSQLSKNHRQQNIQLRK